MSSSSRPSPPSPATPLELEITVVSAKHLKNVNWRHGNLKPYAVVSLDLDPDRRAATKPDESGSTKPVWNERLTLPLPLPFSYPDPSPHLLLAIDIYHSKPSETPKPLVGTARSPLKDLIEAAYPGASSSTTLDLRRPSGRPQGKIRIKLAVRELPLPPPAAPESNYPVTAPPSGYYYSSAPPPPPPPPPVVSVRDFRSYSPSPPPYGNPIPAYNPSASYSDPYYSSAASGYYSSAGYYSAPPMPPPSRPYDRSSGYSYGYPSAPVDYSTGPSSYEPKQKGGRLGMGAGLAVGAAAGALGGLALEEGLKHEEEKIAERVESDMAAREDYSDYRADY